MQPPNAPTFDETKELHGRLLDYILKVNNIIKPEGKKLLHDLVAYELAMTIRDLSHYAAPLGEPIEPPSDDK